MKPLRIVIPACIGWLANSSKRRDATTKNRSGFHAGSRVLSILVAGLWLISANAYAQIPPGRAVALSQSIESTGGVAF
ncbi:MAG: hypothetical protein ACLQAT_08035 [Candidatus Binataceae bacterium]